MDGLFFTAVGICVGLFIGFFWGYETSNKDRDEISKQLGET